MLVLTRKAGESIIVGDDIVIKVIGMDGDQVKIGIEAPHNVTIHREEVYKLIQEENRLAGQKYPAISLEQLKKLNDQSGSGMRIQKEK